MQCLSSKFLIARNPSGARMFNKNIAAILAAPRTYPKPSSLRDIIHAESISLRSPYIAPNCGWNMWRLGNVVRMSASINARVSGLSDRLARARHVRYESYNQSMEKSTQLSESVTSAQGQRISHRVFPHLPPHRGRNPLPPQLPQFRVPMHDFPIR